MTAMLSGECSRSVTARRPIAIAAPTAMVRTGCRREPTLSDHRPAAILPAAPRIWATVTIVPAEAADQPRSVISHTRVNVQITACGATSSTETA